MLLHSLARSFVHSRFHIAMICIALCTGYTTARAQNEPKNAASEEQAERQRIGAERGALKKTLEQQRQACYQKLAVTPCLNEARDQHNDKMRDLKRQEVALNDTQRKRAAADRLRAVDDRNSPQAQQNVAERRGRALEASGKREEERTQRDISREAKIAASASAPIAPNAFAPDRAAPKAALLPQNPARAQRSAKTPVGERPGHAAKMERSRQQAAQREKAAAERRANAQEREAKRKKPAAQALPTPAS